MATSNEQRKKNIQAALSKVRAGSGGVVSSGITTTGKVSVKGYTSSSGGGGSSSTGGTKIIVDSSGNTAVVPEDLDVKGGNTNVTINKTTGEIEVKKGVTRAETFSEAAKERFGISEVATDTATKTTVGDKVITQSVYGTAVTPKSATVDEKRLGEAIAQRKKQEEKNVLSNRTDNRISSGVVSNNIFNGSDIQEAKKKVNWETQLADYSKREKGTFVGILAGSGSATLSFGKGVVSGFVSVFNPKTYSDFYYSVTHPKETREAIYQFGTEVYTNPEKGFETAGEFYGFGKGMKVLTKGVQTLNKLRPSYVSTKTQAVEIVPDVTIETPLEKLKTFEGKTVPTVHTTYSNVKAGTIIAPQAEGASGWRAKVGQLNFYTSAPQEVKITKLLNYGAKEVPATFAETPIVPRYKPVVYGGYIGIGEGTSYSTSAEISLLPKSGKALIFRETQIKPTPSYIAKQSLKNVVKYQTENVGTYVAAENIKGASVEGQFTTSSGTVEKPLVKIVEGQGELSGKFTYYNVKKPVPKILGGEKSILKPIWNAITSENKKIKFREVAFEELPPSDIVVTTIEQENILPQKILSSEPSTYVSAGSLTKNIPLSSINKIYSSNTKIIPVSYSIPKSSIKTQVSSISKSSIISISYPSISKSLSSVSSSKSIISSLSSVKSSVSSISSSKSSVSSQSSLSSSISSSSSLSSLSSSSSSESSVSSSISSSRSSSSKSPYNLLTTGFSSKINRNEAYLSKSYNVLIGSGKKQRVVATGLPYGKALKAGASETLRSIKAKFKLVEAGTTAQQDIAYEPSPKFFREYKIRQGRRIETPLEFIQKRGTRLTTQSERFEIQRYKQLAEVRL